jgi:hypothetical protein
MNTCLYSERLCGGHGAGTLNDDSTAWPHRAEEPSQFSLDTVKAHGGDSVSVAVLENYSPLVAMSLHPSHVADNII